MLSKRYNSTVPARVAGMHTFQYLVRSGLVGRPVGGMRGRSGWKGGDLGYTKPPLMTCQALFSTSVMFFRRRWRRRLSGFFEEQLVSRAMSVVAKEISATAGIVFVLGRRVKGVGEKE